MDAPDCDPDELANTYRQFFWINALLSRSRMLYRRWLRPRMGEPGATYSLLDIGFGGGDIPLRIAAWARREGIDLRVRGVETDARAVEYANQQPLPDGVRFEHGDAHELAARGERYDFVLSNHMLHHLVGEELEGMLATAATLCRRVALFNDLVRTDVGYGLFSAVTPLFFRRSFIREDGLRSIRRSYTREELARRVGAGWRVTPLYPFRLLLVYDRERG
ncbi:MAG: methyltransferase domain-containing protein [Thiohalorhabdus sp.]|uniref:methyltransferase domain-containing protein n=1 Tax=Thiohalorhabdus sp. TaxID=3094134 RepID=UPI00397EF503